MHLHYIITSPPLPLFHIHQLDIPASLSLGFHLLIHFLIGSLHAGFYGIQPGWNIRIVGFSPGWKRLRHKRHFSIDWKPSMIA